MKRARLVALLATLPLCAALHAQPTALAPLSDTELATVAGGAISFDFANFSVSGDARFTYYAPPPSTASTWIGNIELSRSDDPLRPFTDPYNINFLTRPGLSDYIDIAFPANPDGTALWQFTYDWGVNAAGIDFQGGAWVFRDTAYFGGGFQLGTPPVGAGEGVTFGLALHKQTAGIFLRPRGRANVAEQLHLSGVRMSAARLEADGTTTTQLNEPWQIAEVTSQPGIFNAITDASGTPRLHVGIGWPTDPVNNPAPWGTLSIANLTFTSDVTPSRDLGASRIGGVQIQYLDILFRP